MLLSMAKVLIPWTIGNIPYFLRSILPFCGPSFSVINLPNMFKGGSNFIASEAR